MANEDLKSSNMAIIQVLAGLIQNPLLFADNKYRFDIKDFPEQFHQIVFGAIEHLAKSPNGLKKMDIIDIDQFLKGYPIQYKIFTKNNGIEYLTKAMKVYNDKKFDYYYSLLRKFSLLRELDSMGISTSEFYKTDLTKPEEIEKMQEDFDRLSVNDILSSVELKFLLARESFGSTSDLVENHIGDGAKDLKEQLKVTPVMGVPLESPKMTTLYRGQRLGAVYMESSPSGAGKTRRAIGEACHVAIPEYWDDDQKKWVETGACEKALIIETELELDEIQTMTWAYVAGVPESHIIDGRYTAGEEERVDRAIELIKKAKLYFVSITNYNGDDIINVIKKYHQKYGVEYVYYDYLSENPKILAEGTAKTHISGLRTDQVLLQLITALKDCAKQLGIFIWTATQLSGGYKEAKELDASFLRSAKALADKIDIGSIMLPVRELDEPIINEYLAHKGFQLRPNFVISVYKIRRGQYQNIKIYIYYDRGTCRVYDTFVTDAKGVMLPIASTNVEIILNKTAEANLENSVYTSQFGFDY